jgi:hypothetical protein
VSLKSYPFVAALTVSEFGGAKFCLEAIWIVRPHLKLLPCRLPYSIFDELCLFFLDVVTVLFVQGS